MVAKCDNTKTNGKTNMNSALTISTKLTACKNDEPKNQFSMKIFLEAICGQLLESLRVEDLALLKALCY